MPSVQADDVQVSLGTFWPCLALGTVELPSCHCPSPRAFRQRLEVAQVDIRLQCNKVTPPYSRFQTNRLFLPSHSLHQDADPNSPVTFQRNIQLARQNVADIQNLVHSALAGIQNAYHPGNSPAQTEANIVTLKQTIKATADLLLQSGVGALSVLPMPGPGETVAPPSEQQMLADANRSIKLAYDQLRRNQESVAVVANLLGPPARSGR